MFSLIHEVPVAISRSFLSCLAAIPVQTVQTIVPPLTANFQLIVSI
jgi:hypothetical protein